MPRELLRDVEGGWLECHDLVAELAFEPAMDGVLWCVRTSMSIPGCKCDRVSDDEFIRVSGVRGCLYFLPESGQRMFLGASLGHSSVARRPGAHTYDMRIPISSAALAAFETVRDGKEPRFELHFTAAPLRSGAHVHGAEGSLPMFVSEVLRFGVTREAWVGALATAGVSHNIVFEIPLGGPQRKGYEEVLSHLLEAKNEFDRGGEIGWRGCVAAVRHAFDAWPNTSRSSTIEFERGMSLGECFARLRQAVRKASNSAHHSPASGWTRNDALFFLTAAATLLARETG